MGIEEELLLADPDTLDLVDRGPEIVAALRAPTAVKLELPRAQVEIVTPASRSAPEARAALAEGRAELARAAAGLARPIAAGGHPFGAVSGPLNAGERYEAIAAEYGPVARRQLVSALQVHVAIGDAAAALDVHNALRSYLPELAALAANAPFRAGRDSGLASIRPKVCESMPRQGVPPAIPSWAAFADLLSWGARSATLADPGAWWWELRPHPAHGTLELRVPDAQATVADAEAVVAVAHALVAHLLERRDCRRAAPGRSDVADRGEPLVGVSLGRRGRARRPAHGRAPDDAREAPHASRRPRARRRGARRRARPRAGAGARRAQRRAPPAGGGCRDGRSQRRAGCARGDGVARGRLPRGRLTAMLH